MTSRIRNLGMKTRRTSYRTALGSLKHFVSEFSAIFPDGPEVQRDGVFCMACRHFIGSQGRRGSFFGVCVWMARSSLYVLCVV